MVELILLSVIVYILSLFVMLVTLYDNKIKITNTSSEEDKVFFCFAFLPIVNTLIALLGVIISLPSLIKHITKTN